VRETTGATRATVAWPAATVKERFPRWAFLAAIFSSPGQAPPVRNMPATSMSKRSARPASASAPKDDTPGCHPHYCISTGARRGAPLFLGSGRRLLRRRRVGRLGPNRLGRQLRCRHRGRVQGRLPPGDFQGQLGVIDDATVPAEATLVVGRAHEDAIDRARVHAQGTQHALGVVDLEAVDAEALANGVLDLLDVDAIDGTGAGTLVAADAGGQVEAVEAAVARLDRHRQFGVLELLREGPAAVGLEEIPKRDVHALADGLDRPIDITEPSAHGGLAVERCVDPEQLVEIISGRRGPARWWREGRGWHRAGGTTVCERRGRR